MLSREFSRRFKRYVKRVLRYDEVHTVTEFQRWMQEIEPTVWNHGELTYNPKISVVVPVYNVSSEMLKDCIDSVLAQTYKNWELILVDDCSTWKNVKKVLSKYENIINVEVIYREENGNISEATNTGLKHATGDFIAFMDCDDVLASQALYEIAYKLNENHDLDFIYSDEDKITESSCGIRKNGFEVNPKERHTPFFKPDWSPDAFMCLNYTNHLSVYRTEVVRRIQGLRTKYDGSQDYDFVLRFMEQTQNSKVGHVDKILYHWRERKESVAYDPNSKPYALKVTRELKEEMITRRGLKAKVEYVEGEYQYRLVYLPDEMRKVSIIIPSKDNFNVLKHCLDTIHEYTDYPNYEVIIVDNGSSEEVQDKINQYIIGKNIYYHYEKQPFNFSKMCNLGAKYATGDLLLFLNDDIGILKKGWLSRMVGHALQKHVGAVGAKLLYPDSTDIQHDGVLNLACGPSHAFSHMDDHTSYYFARNRVEYNWLAVTGACLLVERCKFDEIGGFDEDLPVAYNDVDLCFKLVEAGYYNVCRNDVILYHYESVSRGLDNQDDEKMLRLAMERMRLYDNHPMYEGYDPFYNSNLGGYNISFSIRVLPDKSRTPLQKECIVEPWNLVSDLDVQERKFVVKICESQEENCYVRLNGWFFAGNLEVDSQRELYIILKSELGKLYRIKPERFNCEEVRRVYGTEHGNVGFEIFFNGEILDFDGEKYQVGVMISDIESDMWSIQWTKHWIM